MKKYKLFYTQEVKTFLSELKEQISLENGFSTAYKFFKELDKKINLLSDFPNMGTFDNSCGLDFIYHYPYFIYHVVDHTATTVDIISIWHGARGYFNPSDYCIDN